MGMEIGNGYGNYAANVYVPEIKDAKKAKEIAEFVEKIPELEKQGYEDLSRRNAALGGKVTYYQQSWMINDDGSVQSTVYSVTETEMTNAERMKQNMDERLERQKEKKEAEEKAKERDGVSVSLSDEGLLAAMQREKALRPQGVIMTDFASEFASRMPSIYGEKDENGEYERKYFSASETASNMLKTYATMYDEITRGYEDGTRETYIEDKSAADGYRKLTKDEDLAELDMAYRNYAERYAANNDDKVLQILYEHTKKVVALGGDRVEIASEASTILEQRMQERDLRADFGGTMRMVADQFVGLYQDNRGVSVDELLRGISIFGDVRL